MKKIGEKNFAILITILFSLFLVFSLRFATAGCSLTSYGCGEDSMWGYNFGSEQGSPSSYCKYTSPDYRNRPDSWGAALNCDATGVPVYENNSCSEDLGSNNCSYLCTSCNIKGSDCSVVYYYGSERQEMTFYDTPCVNPIFLASITNIAISSAQKGNIAESAVEHGYNSNLGPLFSIQFNFTRNFGPARDYFQVSFVGENGKRVIAKTDYSRVTQDAYSGMVTIDGIIAPCTPGKYKLIVDAVYGDQNFGGWDENFITGPFKNSKPSDILKNSTPIDFLVENFTYINSSIDLAVEDIQPMQVVKGVNLIKDKDMLVQVKAKLNDEFWPKDDWPVCKSPVKIFMPYLGESNPYLFFPVNALIRYDGGVYSKDSFIGANQEGTYNFLPQYENTAPPKQATDDMTFEASIAPHSSLNWLDYNSANDVKVIIKKVKEVDKTNFRSGDKLKIGYLVLISRDQFSTETEQDKASAMINERLALKLHQIKELIIGAFPLPRDSVDADSDIEIQFKPIEYFNSDVFKINLDKSVATYKKDKGLDYVIVLHTGDQNVKPENGVLDLSDSTKKNRWDLGYTRFSAPQNYLVRGLGLKIAPNLNVQLKSDYGWWLQKDNKEDLESSAGHYDLFNSFFSNSYFPMFKSSEGKPFWMSINSYNQLADKFVSGGHFEDPVTLSISGFIYKNDSIELSPSYVDENGIIDTSLSGSYSVEFLDSSNNVLNSVSFEPTWGNVGYYENMSFFSLEAEYPTNSVKIRVKHGSVILAEINKSANAPTINSLIATNNNGNLTISWSANDADADKLYYSLDYNCSGWKDSYPYLIEADLNSSDNITLDTSNMPGGSSCSVRLKATDNTHTTVAYSNSFSIENKAPMTFISAPLNNSVFSNDSVVSFSGWATDPEFGALDDQNYTFIWTSNINGFLSNNASFDIGNLSIGQHIITLNVSDGSLSSVDSIIINVTTEQRPDIQITGIEFPNKPTVNDNITLGADLWNIINSLDNFTVKFYDGDPDNGGILIGEQDNLSINSNEVSGSFIDINASTLSQGQHNIFVNLTNIDVPYCSEEMRNNPNYLECSNFWCNNSDINFDGKVNSTDADLWKEYYDSFNCINWTFDYDTSVSTCEDYNTTAATCDENNSFCFGADINRDGVLNLSDNTTLTNYFGQTGCKLPRLTETNTANNIFNQTFTIYPSLNDTKKFFVRNDWGYNVAWIGNAGNIVLAGGCFNTTEINATTCDAPENSLTFKNSTGGVNAYINSYGNLCISQGSCQDAELALSCNPTANAFVAQDDSGQNMSYIDFNGKLCLKGGLHEYGTNEQLEN